MGCAGNPTASEKAVSRRALRCLAGARIQVEIASDDQSRPVDVLAAVRKDLVQLPEPKFIGASAFQMQVIGHYLAPVNGASVTSAILPPRRR